MVSLPSSTPRLRERRSTISTPGCGALPRWLDRPGCLAQRLHPLDGPRGCIRHLAVRTDAVRDRECAPRSWVLSRSDRRGPSSEISRRAPRGGELGLECRDPLARRSSSSPVLVVPAARLHRRAPRPAICRSSGCSRQRLSKPVTAFPVTSRSRTCVCTRVGSSSASSPP